LELLTVIAVLGVLVGILVPTVAAVQTAALRAQTKARFAQWSAAMELFRQEYGYYPSIATEGMIDPAKFAPALLGKRNLAGEPLDPAAPAAAWCGNVRRLAFYTISADELDSGGANLADTFGNTGIAVRVDVNGDGRIDAQDTGAGYTAHWPAVAGASGTTLAPPGLVTLPARVVFYSAGRGESPTDLIFSWK
jgi:type II secretory pathway pseudopilin PulG